MKASYFKLRKTFDFSPHPYDIGNLFGPWRKNADNHYLLKLYTVIKEKYADFYTYHLNYSLQQGVTDEEFFKELWQLLDARISYFQNKNPFARSHFRDEIALEKLRSFQKFLMSIDKWNLRPLTNVILDKDRNIQELIAKNQHLQMQLDELAKYEVKQKLSIEEGHLPTLVDIFQQLRELRLPSRRLLLKSDHKMVYAKMISKYFSHGEKQIPIETARNYFVEVKGDIPVKGTSVYADQQIFKLIPIE